MAFSSGRDDSHHGTNRTMEAQVTLKITTQISSPLHRSDIVRKFHTRQQSRAPKSFLTRTTTSTRATRNSFGRAGLAKGSPIVHAGEMLRHLIVKLSLSRLSRTYKNASIGTPQALISRPVEWQCWIQLKMYRWQPDYTPLKRWTFLLFCPASPYVVHPFRECSQSM